MRAEIVEGEQKNIQDLLIEAMQERFGGRMDEDIAVQVKQIRNWHVLNPLFRTSLRAKSLDEFRRNLSQRKRISVIS